jgi:hypothetical protein
MRVIPGYFSRQGVTLQAEYFSFVKIAKAVRTGWVYAFGEHSYLPLQLRNPPSGGELITRLDQVYTLFLAGSRG